jgi:hypothetical protein
VTASERLEEAKAEAWEEYHEGVRLLGTWHDSKWSESERALRATLEAALTSPLLARIEVLETKLRAYYPKWIEQADCYYCPECGGSDLERDKIVHVGGCPLHALLSPSSIKEDVK